MKKEENTASIDYILETFERAAEIMHKFIKEDRETSKAVYEAKYKEVACMYALLDTIIAYIQQMQKSTPDFMRNSAMVRINAARDLLPPEIARRVIDIEAGKLLNQIYVEE